MFLFLFSLHHFTQKSNTAGMLMLWFLTFRSFPKIFGYLQFPQWKISPIVSFPTHPCTLQAIFPYCAALHYNTFQHLPPHTAYLIDPFYAAPRLAVLYSGRLNSTHYIFSEWLVNISQFRERLGILSLAHFSIFSSDHLHTVLYLITNNMSLFSPEQGRSLVGPPIYH